MTIVTTLPMDPAIWLTKSPETLRSAATALPARSANSGGRLYAARSDFSRSTPSARLVTSATTYGTSASASRRATPARISSATAHTIAAATVLDRPRARRRTTNGANEAAITMAMAIDAVTVHSVVASSQPATTRAAIARTRQPRAARLPSQSGTISWPGPAPIDLSSGPVAPFRHRAAAGRGCRPDVSPEVRGASRG